VRIAPWRQTSDRELRIRGRHSREFYRRADDLLRATIAADASRIDAARESLMAAREEVEA
jgi:hypothetical protein